MLLEMEWMGCMLLSYRMIGDVNDLHFDARSVYAEHLPIR